MRTLLALLICLPACLFSQPCTIINASGCGCPDGRDTCYLLPDITISWESLANDGPTEYSQTGNGANNGRLRITGTTPNTGWGPFTVRGTDYYICGNDTLYSPSGNVICINGTTPTNLLQQRIYKKNGNTMTFEDHWAGGQTYHPTHNHNHVDDWVVFTLRMEDPNEPDTLEWPIIGDGAKIGFCLMDYGSCNAYNGYCRDNQKYGSGSVLTSANIPNYGLGGGQYSCSPVEQGISVGYVDIYSQTLDGMWINIPPNTCNGNYWIIAEVDPRGHFIESDKSNNWTAVPYTLTKQTPPGTVMPEISMDGTTYLCRGNGVTLTSASAMSYLWSTGETTQSITATAPGDYFVQTYSTCGTLVSDTLAIAELTSEITDYEQDTACISGSLELTALGTGSIAWYDAPANGAPLFTGNLFTTPVLNSTHTYYAENISQIPGTVHYSAPGSHSGSSQYSSFNGYIIFDCHAAFTLKSVQVFTDYAGLRRIEWRTSNGTVIKDTTVHIPSGTSRVTLDFNITPGTNYQLGTNQGVNNSSFGVDAPQLKRSSGNNVNYPYEVPGIVSLKGSPYDSPATKYYYYFYDWEVEVGAAVCISPRQPVAAVIIPEPSVSFTGLDTAYQVYDAPDMLIGSPPGGQFSGAGISGNIFDPMAAGIGHHVITYSFTDNFGCFNEHSITTRVRKGQIFASAGNDIVMCPGDSVTLTATGGTIFEWSTGDTAATILANPSATATYMVTVSDIFGSFDVASVTVEVASLPVVDFSGLDSLYFAGDAPAALSGSPPGGLFSGAGIHDDSFHPSDVGVGGPYQITYSFTDSNGCENSITKDVTVLLPVKVATGMKQHEISVYPNPADRMIHIDFTKTEISSAQIRMFNPLGALVMSEQVTAAQHGIKILDVSALSNGIYVLEIVTPEHSLITKVIKE